MEEFARKRHKSGYREEMDVFENDGGLEPLKNPSLFFLNPPDKTMGNRHIAGDVPKFARTYILYRRSIL